MSKKTEDKADEKVVKVPADNVGTADAETVKPLAKDDPGVPVGEPARPEQRGLAGKPIKGEFRVGATGDHVAELQRRLNDRIDARGFGFKVHVDGVYGAKTNSAVHLAQAEDGLPVDGVVDDRLFHG